MTVEEIAWLVSERIANEQESLVAHAIKANPHLPVSAFILYYEVTPDGAHIRIGIKDIYK